MIFYVFLHDTAWPVWTPRARLAEFIKRTTKALCLVVSEDNIFMFSHCKSMEANDPKAGPDLTPVAWMAGFRERTTTHCYIQNMKALGLVVSEKTTFLACMDPGARLAGILKRTTIHCYTKNRKALCLVVSEKNIFLCFSHYKSGAGHCWHDL